MSEGIVYQNKDILFKILGQTYEEKSFAVYGITFGTNCITLRIDQAFLSHIDGEAVFGAVRHKIQFGILPEDDDLMKLVILPLAIPSSLGKQEMLTKVVDLAEQIPIEKQRIFALSGVIVESDKFIDRKYSEQIRSGINIAVRAAV